MADKKYIEYESLLKEVESLEQLARKRVYDTPTNSPAYERYYAQWQARTRVLTIIKAQPAADVVEVVRCKDCKYWKRDEDFGMFCNHYGGMLTETVATDFCSMGERKDNDSRRTH